MSYELTGASALLDDPCHYGTSRLMVRGPKRELDEPYIAFLGGTEVYGRFVGRPFVACVEEHLAQDCVNLGSINAGLDSFARDEGVLSVANGADLTILQILGAQNISNDLYRVHPRRNDRFLQATPRLRELFPEIDFTEFHFNKHLLSALAACSQDRFDAVCAELQATWVARMTELVQSIDGPILLLWLRYDLNHRSGGEELLELEPTLVDRPMVDALRSNVDGVVEVQVRTAEEADDTDGMLMGQLDLPTARHMIGPSEHVRIAEALRETVQQVLKARA